MRRHCRNSVLQVTPLCAAGLSESHLKVFKLSQVSGRRGDGGGRARGELLP